MSGERSSCKFADYCVRERKFSFTLPNVQYSHTFLVSFCKSINRANINWSQISTEMRILVVLLFSGIQCTNKLNEINEAVASSDCALVAQKYIGEKSEILSKLQKFQWSVNRIDVPRVNTRLGVEIIDRECSRHIFARKIVKIVLLLFRISDVEMNYLVPCRRWVVFLTGSVNQTSEFDVWRKKSKTHFGYLLFSI